MVNFDQPELFADVLAKELDEIRLRRKSLPQAPPPSLIAVQAFARGRAVPQASADENWEASLDEFTANRKAVLEACPRENLVGLALSGGGIRSATFCLGLLQALDKLRLLPMFDYLSTVSGGGFIGGCWSAWMSRDEFSVDLTPLALPATLNSTKIDGIRFDPQSKRLLLHGKMSEATREALLGPFRQALAAGGAPAQEAMEKVSLFCDRVHRMFPAPERIEPERARQYCGPTARKFGVAESGISAGEDPIHHLRLFSNYLTPHKGLLSSDTWRAAVVVLRNLVMNWLVVLPILLAIIAVPRIYFAAEPKWTTQFRDVGEYYSRLPIVEEDTGDKSRKITPTKGHSAYVLTEDLLGIQRILQVGPGQTPSSDALQRAELLESDYLAVLQWRAVWAAIPLLAVLSWLVVLSAAWMACVPERRKASDWLMGLGTFTGGLLLVACIVWFVGGPFGAALHLLRIWDWDIDTWKAVCGNPVAWGLLTVLVPSSFMVGWSIWPLFRLDDPQFSRNEVRQNRIVRIQTKLLILLAILFLVLFASGFAYELFMYAWTVYAGPSIRAVGWLAILGSLAATVYTAWKAAPTGGGDRHQDPLQSAGVSWLIFAATPLLVLALLTIVGETAVHNFLDYVDHHAFEGMRKKETLPPLFKLTAAAGVGLLMSVLLGVSEMSWQTSGQASRPVKLVITLLAACLYSFAVAHSVGHKHANWLEYPSVATSIVAAAGFFIGVRWLLDWAGLAATDCSKFRAGVGALARTREKWFAPMLACAGIAAFLTPLMIRYGGLPGVRLPHQQLDHLSGFNAVLSITPYLGSLLCLIVLCFEVKWGDGYNRRTLALLTATWVLLAFMLGIGLYNHSLAKFEQPQDEELRLIEILPVLHIYALIDLIAVALACVVAIGWTADPNALSLHDFYKFRLVRAYLGASNPRRALKNSQITESVEGDDVKMSQLANCSRGGPYQLVNTTLNLTAGHDLATAQRSSAHFLLSKLFCGSLRTGFRPTSLYMDGRLTLGTAVAISGAAASPTMGAKSPNAMFSALLTLLNIRLGYWAPTPHLSRWRSPQARLWPFYTMREFLSETNDLGSYCCLTDGGHFDNTGLYSLVQRGCRHIVVVDCGADPAPPSFEDLGDALRRCRIDFGAEIDLELDPLIAAAPGVKAATDTPETTLRGAPHDSKTSKGRPFVLGKIIYSAEHTSTLGWINRDSVKSRTGWILWVKPSLMADDGADVRQYGFAHSDFPQQSTAEQWFDEAQFESYRRLGEETGREIFKGIEVFPQNEPDAEDAVFTPAEAAGLFGELRKKGDG